MTVLYQKHLFIVCIVWYGSSSDIEKCAEVCVLLLREWRYCSSIDMLWYWWLWYDINVCDCIEVTLLLVTNIAFVIPIAWHCWCSTLLLVWHCDIDDLIGDRPIVILTTRDIEYVCIVVLLLLLTLVMVAVESSESMSSMAYGAMKCVAQCNVYNSIWCRVLCCVWCTWRHCCDVVGIVDDCYCYYCRWWWWKWYWYCTVIIMTWLEYYLHWTFHWRYLTPTVVLNLVRLHWLSITNFFDMGPCYCYALLVGACYLLLLLVLWCCW